MRLYTIFIPLTLILQSLLPSNHLYASSCSDPFNNKAQPSDSHYSPKPPPNVHSANTPHRFTFQDGKVLDIHPTQLAELIFEANDRIIEAKMIEATVAKRVNKTQVVAQLKILEKKLNGLNFSAASRNKLLKQKRNLEGEFRRADFLGKVELYSSLADGARALHKAQVDLLEAREYALRLEAVRRFILRNVPAE